MLSLATTESDLADAPFRSLDELRQAHEALSRTLDERKPTAEDVQAIEAFLRRGAATGAVLDSGDERRAAQALVNFWTANLNEALTDGDSTLPNRRAKIDDFLLATFDAPTLEKIVIEPAEEWLRRQSEVDQTLARRILLRLLRLRKDNQSFEVRANTQAVCDDLQPNQQAENVLAKLAELGLVRTTHSSTGRQEVALRSRVFMERWSRMATWLDERRRIRAIANDWEANVESQAKSNADARGFLKSSWRRIKNGIKWVGANLEMGWRTVWSQFKSLQSSPAVLTDDEFKEAETFRDWNGAELKLVHEQRRVDQELNEWYKAGLGLSAGIGVLLLALVIVAFWGWAEAGDAKKAALTTAENEKVKRWISQTYCLTSHANLTLNSEPQKSALLALEAWRHIKEKSTDRIDNETPLNQAKAKAGNVLRSALANIDGIGFHADLGLVTELAAIEMDEKLRWLAAADLSGQIALWDLRDRSKTKVEILPFGYAPPIRRLLITNDERYLIALNYHNNITIWNLHDEARTVRVFETVAKGDASRIGIPPRLRISSDQKWLQIDDDHSTGKFIYLGDANKGPQEIAFDLAELQDARVPTSYPFFSFTKNSRWFARVSDNGIALIWDLAKAKPGEKFLPTLLDFSKTPATAQAVNGEFMDQSNRLVAYFTDGTALYWDLDSKTDRWGDVNYRDLKTAIGMPKQQGSTWPKVRTNRRGTHVILAPSSGTDAFCFDGNQLSQPAAIKLEQFDEKGIVADPETDATGKFLVARYLPQTFAQYESLRIWDLEWNRNRDRDKTTQFTFDDGIRDAKVFEKGIFVRGNTNVVRWIELPLRKGWPPEELRGIDGPAQVLAQSQKGNLVLAGGQHGEVRAWRIKDRKNIDLKTIREARKKIVEDIPDADLEQATRRAVGKSLHKTEWNHLDLGHDDDLRPTLTDGPARIAELKNPETLKGKVTLRDWTDTLVEAKPTIKILHEMRPAKRFHIQFKKGRTYLINMRSTSIDSYLVLTDGQSELDRDDDGGGYPDARIRFHCQKDGDYEIFASTFDGSVGDFRLTVSEVTLIPPTAVIDLVTNASVVRQGSITNTNDDLGEGPLVVYQLELPKTPATVQVELTSSTFEPLLRLQKSNGDVIGEATAFVGRTRMVFLSDPGTVYRIVVIAKRGNATAFDQGKAVDYKLNVERR